MVLVVPCTVSTDLKSHVQRLDERKLFNQVNPDAGDDASMTGLMNDGKTRRYYFVKASASFHVLVSSIVFMDQYESKKVEIAPHPEQNQLLFAVAVALLILPNPQFKSSVSEVLSTSDYNLLQNLQGT